MDRQAERYGLGADGAAFAEQGDGPWLDRPDNRLFVEAILWLARLPAIQRWYRSGVRESLFKALSDDANFEYILVDGTFVRAHQHSAGAPKTIGTGFVLAPAASKPPKISTHFLSRQKLPISP